MLMDELSKLAGSTHHPAGMTTLVTADPMGHPQRVPKMTGHPLQVGHDESWMLHKLDGHWLTLPLLH